METLKERILAILRAKPKQTANEIAAALECVNRDELQKELRTLMKQNLLVQDKAYKWSIAELDSENETGSVRPNTSLARLARYYLACLGYENAGVSLQLESNNIDYFEIEAAPRSNEKLPLEPCQNLLARTRTEKGRYELYFGHLVAIAASDATLMIEPIILFPIEPKGDDGHLAIDFSFPIINQMPFKRYTNADKDAQMGELIQLETELGFADDNAQLEIDEVAMRLKMIRKEWPWIETPASDAPDIKPVPLEQIRQEGIYRRSIILMAERPTFTRGLENELGALAKLKPKNYANTALNTFLSSDDIPERVSETLPAPLLEVLPMNLEQRQAVKRALTQPLTIITGPPGTGKSQVVTNLLINAAWSGKRILFVSRNNKAVDVVETRINELGPRQILLRVGRPEHQANLAEYLNSLLSGIVPSDTAEAFENAKIIYEKLSGEFLELKKEEEKLIELRNQTDLLEQDAEDARNNLGETVFSQALQLDAEKIENSINEISAEANNADVEFAPFFTKICWPFFKNRRFKKLAAKLSEFSNPLEEINVKLPGFVSEDGDIAEVKNAIKIAAERISQLKKSVAYQKSLQELKAQSLADIAKREVALLEKIAYHSKELWGLWLRLQPTRISKQKRRILGQYISLFKMVSQPQGVSSLIWRQYYEALAQISDLLPCWAVTSLSAKGRIPFSAGTFDIVVFDEASQCDIASALPILYRAKSAVIIGDLKQLSHISSLPRVQDNALIEKFELIEEFADWAYSHQSLFMLSAGKASKINLVDHHRSHADIINFANAEFYEGMLRVVTRYDRLRFITSDADSPGIRWFNIKGEVTRPRGGGAQNTIEAEEVVKILRALVINKGYEGKIGVVTPFNAQSNLIKRLINQNRELSDALNRQGFLAETVHKFQGDERDVMIFSPVVSSGLTESTGAYRFLKHNGNLFNVAITRARAKLLVVGDLDACKNSGISYLARFANYASSLETQQAAGGDVQIKDFGASYPEVVTQAEISVWEKRFYEAAYAAGFRLIPQYRIEQYSVDFVLFDGDRKLVIEVDGERYHRNWTGELCRRDQLRNQRLFELGYEVFRFWVYEIRDDLEGCFEKMREWQSQG